MGPEAPAQTWQREKGKTPNLVAQHKLDVKFSDPPNPADLLKVVKAAVSLICPGYRSGKQLNDDQGQAVYQLIWAQGFELNTNGSNTIKEFVKDQRLDTSDPLIYNRFVATIMGAFNSPESRMELHTRLAASPQRMDEPFVQYIVDRLNMAEALRDLTPYQKAILIQKGMVGGSTAATIITEMTKLGPSQFNSQVPNHSALTSLMKQSWTAINASYNESDAPNIWATEAQRTKHYSTWPQQVSKKKQSVPDNSKTTKDTDNKGYVLCNVCKKRHKLPYCTRPGANPKWKAGSDKTQEAGDQSKQTGTTPSNQTPASTSASGPNKGSTEAKGK